MKNFVCTILFIVGFALFFNEEVNVEKRHQLHAHGCYYREGDWVLFHETPECMSILEAR